MYMWQCCKTDKLGPHNEYISHKLTVMGFSVNLVYVNLSSLICTGMKCQKDRML